MPIKKERSLMVKLWEIRFNDACYIGLRIIFTVPENRWNIFREIA